MYDVIKTIKFKKWENKGANKEENEKGYWHVCTYDARISNSYKDYLREFWNYKNNIYYAHIDNIKNYKQKVRRIMNLNNKCNSWMSTDIILRCMKFVTDVLLIQHKKFLSVFWFSFVYVMNVLNKFLHIFSIIFHPLFFYVFTQKERWEENVISDHKHFESSFIMTHFYTSIHSSCLQL